MNEFSDSMGRVVDYDYWSVSGVFFNSLFGSFSVDRFASSDTAKSRRFYSKFWCPRSEGTDAFSTTSEGENNWLLPPVYSIPQAVLHPEFSSKTGALLLQKCPSADF